MKAKSKAKTEGGPSAADIRRALFVEAYLANGFNGLQAALSAGYSPNGAGQQAARLLKNVKVSAEISKRSQGVLAKLELTADRVLEELAKIAYFNASDIKASDKIAALGKAMQYLNLLPRPGLNVRMGMSVGAAEVAQVPAEQRSLYDIGRRIAFTLAMTAEAIEQKTAD